MTLIEVLIYCALLSILMVGVFSSVYVVMDTENEDKIVDDSRILNIKLYE